MDTEQLASTEPNDQLVAVDAGDLEEAMEAATRWAGHVRASRHTAGGEQATSAADRIDQATHRLRASSHASLVAKANGGRVRLVYGPLTESESGD